MLPDKFTRKIDAMRRNVDSKYQLRVSHESKDPAWDTFVAMTPGGHHVQTSLWAQIKALLEWQVVRIVVTLEAHIVGGVQVLLKRLPIAGTVGYITRGPLFALDDSVLTKLVMQELIRVGKALHVRALFLQLPDNDNGQERQLPDWGFQPSAIEVAPTATVLVDLSKESSALLAQMNARVRHNIRLGQRRGVAVREGTESDLPAFYRILVATSQRQNFSLYSEQYFLRMWRELSPQGYIKLFLTEYKSEVVSALLVVPFRDTVLYKLGGWSGRHGECRPNEIMHWTAMSWAKTQGYRYYDFEGIDPKIAKVIIKGEVPEALGQSVTSFKLGFGGQVTLFPEPYVYIFNPFLQWAHRRVFPRIASFPMMENVLNRLRTR